MIIHPTGVELIPGNQGEDCPGNGKQTDENGNLIERCCDECDYAMCCLIPFHGRCKYCFDEKCPRAERKFTMRYTAENFNFDNDEWTAEEEKRLRRKYQKLRKIAVLEKLPFSEWTKEELITLIYDYNAYSALVLGKIRMKTGKRTALLRKRLRPISLFVRSGAYKKLFEQDEEYRNG